MIEGGLNVQSVTKTGTGVYDVVFSTPMPDANYAVNVTPDYPGGTARTAMVNDKTTTQFTVSIRNTSSTAANEAFNFQVTATNALPLTGGTGADAWAQCGSTGGVIAGFNIASCTRNGLGDYTVNFTTPMPTSLYSITVTAKDSANIATAQITSQTTTGFVVATGIDGNLRYDSAFSVVVHATNAVLPQAFTEQQIQTVVDHAQSGITNPGASAWGDVDADGNILGGLNVASVTKASTGVYDVVFSTPMLMQLFGQRDRQ